MDTSVRVLLVDDAPGIRHVLGALIRDFGYDVHTAESAREALEAFTANPFPIVVTDIRMPGMDGLEAARVILEAHPQVKVLMVSSLAYDDTINEANKIGTSGFVYKPFDREEVLKSFQKAFAEG